MSDNQRKIRLGAFLPGAGHHVAAWRHPQAQADGGINFAHYKRIAQAANIKTDADQATNLQTEAAVRVSMLRPRFR